MKISEITYQQLFEDERITDFYFDCDASDLISIIGRDEIAGHHECEEAFNRYCEKLKRKYGDVEVEIYFPTDFTRRFASGRITVIDDRYLADKEAYIEAKGKALAKWGYTD